MRVTRDLSCGLTIAIIASHLPFSAPELLRFILGHAATRPLRRRVALSRLTVVVEAAAGAVHQRRSVSIGRLASRAHSPIEPS